MFYLQLSRKMFYICNYLQCWTFQMFYSQLSRLVLAVPSSCCHSLTISTLFLRQHEKTRGKVFSNLRYLGLICAEETKKFMGIKKGGFCVDIEPNIRYSRNQGYLHQSAKGDISPSTKIVFEGEKGMKLVAHLFQEEILKQHKSCSVPPPLQLQREGWVWTNILLHNSASTQNTISWKRGGAR